MKLSDLEKLIDLKDNEELNVIHFDHYKYPNLKLRNLYLTIKIVEKRRAQE